MKYNKIYVLCPYGLTSGGPDALHQIVYYLNRLNIASEIVYCDIKKRSYSIPKAYQIYVNHYLLLSDIKDEKNNALIVPETLTHHFASYHNLDKYIWWLSVNNDTDTGSKINKLLRIFKKLFSIKNLKKLYKIHTIKDVLKHQKYDFKDEGVKHLSASYYAYDYVNKNVKDPSCSYLLVEPISKYFLEHPYVEQKKKDQILYNPKKNGKFLKMIMSYDKGLKYIPLKGYNQAQLLELYSTSKVYIDFGYFPGAERMPKEAVRYGCTIITGMKGASAFYDDVKIDEKYKFKEEESNIPLVIDAIKKLMNNYDEYYHDFDAYRERVDSLEQNFIEGLKKLFL